MLLVVPDRFLIVQAHVPPESGPLISLLNASSRACGSHGRWTLNLNSSVV